MGWFTLTNILVLTYYQLSKLNQNSQILLKFIQIDLIQGFMNIIIAIFNLNVVLYFKICF